MTMSKMMYIEYSGYQFLMIKLLINITRQASMVEILKIKTTPHHGAAVSHSRKKVSKKV